MTKNGRWALIFLSISGVFVGCATYPFSYYFPLQYPNAEQAPYQAEVVTNDLASAGIRVVDIGKGIPVDVIAALPDDFAIAAETGHLIAVFDESGGMGLPSRRIRSVKFSRDFQNAVKTVSKMDYMKYSPPGYPNVVCFRPIGEPSDLFDEGWFSDWLSTISAWEGAQLEIEALNAANQQLARDNATSAETIATADREVARLNDEIAKVETKITEIETRLRELRQKNILFGTVSGSTPKPIPPFDAKRKYDKKDDFFQPVLKDYLEDTSKKDWSTSDQHQSSFEYLDPEIVAGLDAMNSAIKDPSNLPSDIQKGLTDAQQGGKPFALKVNSSTRTPMGQAYVSSGKNPKAAYVGSSHMFGQAVDIQHGHAIGSDGHKALAKFVGHFGFGFTVVNDKPHITLLKSSPRMVARQLAITRAYTAAANQVRATQGGAKENQVFEQSKLLEKKAQLVKDLQQRTAQVQQKQTLFGTVTARYLQFEAELKAEEERIREQERQKAEREKAERERQEREKPARRDPSDRYDREPGVRFPREPKGPPPEKPSRPEATPRERSTPDRPTRDRPTSRDRTPSEPGPRLRLP